MSSPFLLGLIFGLIFRKATPGWGSRWSVPAGGLLITFSSSPHGGLRRMNRITRSPHRFTPGERCRPGAPKRRRRSPLRGRSSDPSSECLDAVCVSPAVRPLSVAKAAKFSSSLAAAWKADTAFGMNYWGAPPSPKRHAICDLRWAATGASRSSARPASDSHRPNSAAGVPGARRARWSSSARFCAWSGSSPSGSP
jgi:hypothetical protein